MYRLPLVRALLKKEGSMERRLFIAMGLFLGVLALPVAQAQEKDAKGKAAKQDRIDGTVHMLDKATKTVTVRLRGKTEQREVLYDDKTAFTYRNKPASFEEVKDGRRVIVLGKHNDKHQLMATRIDVRDK
jgi:Cu/Ag efflux protein CusF